MLSRLKTVLLTRGHKFVFAGVFIVAIATCVQPARVPIMKYQTINAMNKCKSDRDFPQMVRLPFFGNATQVVNDCAMYPNYQVSLALLVFYYTWVEYFGDRDYVVSGLLDDVMIEWCEEKKPIKRGYDLKGERVRNRKALGMVRTKSMAWVYQHGRFDTGKLSDTSLIHELVHLAIRAHNGKHGDPDHEGDKYHGWTSAHTELIKEAKGVLRAYGL